MIRVCCFCGFSKEVHRLLQAAHLLVLPSLAEGLGIVALEAQAAGLPMLCSENAPKEANVTGSLTYLRLSAGYEAWAEKILEARERERKDGSGQIIRAGYDVSQTAGYVESCYRGRKY
jgi:glycosyltransferase involved in cell wall biosynthesis